MVKSASVSVKNNDVLLLVGTMKGLFLLRSGSGRRRWDVGGPHFPGRSVYGVAYDGRDGRRRIWGASEHALGGRALLDRRLRPPVGPARDTPGPLSGAGRRLARAHL